MFSEKYSSFSLLKKHELIEESLDVIELLLIKFSSYFASNQQMTKSQLQITAEAIVQEFHYFNICDLQLALKRIRKQKLYGQLSPNFIINKLEEYREERLSIAESISISDHKKQLKTPTDNDFIEKFYEFRKKNPIPEDSQLKVKKNEEGFRKFWTDYERSKAMKLKLRNKRKEEKTEGKCIWTLDQTSSTPFYITITQN